ncbi:MAG: hypothetical protein AB7P04_11830 [Bacteriovoracia bacterium]
MPPRSATPTFDEYYSAQYGERWPALRTALAAHRPGVLRPNGFADPSFVAEALGSRTMAAASTNCRLADPEEERLEAPCDSRGLRAWYQMDLASVLAAETLDIEPFHRVLDLCAAPGGKALILAEKLRTHGGLTLNELSSARRGRLKQVLTDYLPAPRREEIRVTGFDAAQWCRHESEAYDRVLLDAPCSSEAHVVRQPRHLQAWTPNRSPQLAQRQYALLSSALRLLKPGGQLLYSTCAISKLENDRVVERALANATKKNFASRVLPFHWPLGAPTEFGQIVLPDQDQWGPLYACRLERI